MSPGACGSGKDTSRLLGSGAREAWWLRVREEALADAVADLLSHVPAGWVSVCESNRLRRVVEPGLFLQVRSATEPVHASLRAPFSQVEAVAPPGGLDDERVYLAAVAAALPRSSHDWCLVAPRHGGPVPAAPVNALFRRREGVEAILVRDASGGPRCRVGLFHRGLLPRLEAALDGDPSRTPGLAALGPIRELTYWTTSRARTAAPTQPDAPG